MNYLSGLQKTDLKKQSPWNRSKNQQEKRFPFIRFFDENHRKTKVILGPGGGIGIGCGLGIGAGIVGGIGYGGWAWNHLRFAFGLGVGCGIGIGYGYGLGLGFAWDRPPPVAAPDPKWVVIEI